MFLPTGRAERRIEKKEAVDLLPLGEAPITKVNAITENVSSRGARVITDLTYTPGKLIHLEAPEEHLQLLGRVVYCQRLEQEKFAVGLEFSKRVKEWQAA